MFLQDSDSYFLNNIFIEGNVQKMLVHENNIFNQKQFWKHTETSNLNNLAASFSRHVMCTDIERHTLQC